MTTSPELAKGHRAVAALAVACLLVAGVAVGVRAAYGAFGDGMEVSGTFPRAGQALKVGSDVTYRGVVVGEVRRIELVGHEVRLTLSLGRDRQVPDDVEAVVAPRTLFGEKAVELRGGRPDGDGPHLRDGSVLARTRAGTEVEELIAAADPLLRDIDTTELARLMTSLTQTLDGRGREINRALEPTVAAAGLLEETLDAGVQALDSSARFAREVRDLGPDLNASAAQLNLLLPTLNRARADYVRLLATLRPLADTVAEILVEVRPDVDRLLRNGDNLTRVLIARESELATTVYGLSVYFQTFAEGVSEEVFADGSRAAFFKMFIVLDDIEAMLCALVSPAFPVPPELELVLGSVRDTLLAQSGLLDCSSVLPDGAGPGAGAPPGAEELAQPLLGATGAPDTSAPAGLGAIVDGARGGP